jgi:hypothetical protein
VVLIQEEITKEGKESLALAQAKYTRATCPYSHSNEGHMTHMTKSKPRVQPATVARRASKLCSLGSIPSWVIDKIKDKIKKRKDKREREIRFGLEET